MSTSSPPPPAAAPPSSVTHRRVPPPCWTKDETLLLIEAYRDKWFALQRGNLRASDWEAVAAAVSDSGTTKSPVQCRHKIEKLRKRYRAEKQRSCKHQGKFFSSWDLFPLLDSMGFASSSAFGSGDLIDVVDQHESSTAFDGLPLKLNSRGKADGFSGSVLGFGHDFEGGYGSNFGNFMDSFDSDQKVGAGYGVKLKGKRDLVARGIRGKNNGKTDDGYSSFLNLAHSATDQAVGGRSRGSLGFKQKNFSKFDVNFSPDLYSDDDLEVYGLDEGGGFRPKVSSYRDSVPSGLRSKSYVGTNGCLDPSVDFRVLNGFVSSLRSESGRKNSDGGSKRGLDPLEEMVSSIKVLGERFVKMETMKMEMAREIEKTRMEMELKHNQMILESQQQIVEAFAKALLEKKKKVKVLSPSPTANRNGDDE